MTSNYIYLLKEREFIKTNENIHKLGMTTKENHIRFNQYPKGSILLFQMICNNCKDIEKYLIKIFKVLFIHRKDIGNEYFEGDYKSMIDFIYITIKNQNENCNISNSLVSNLEIDENNKNIENNENNEENNEDKEESDNENIESDNEATVIISSILK